MVHLLKKLLLVGLLALGVQPAQAFSLIGTNAAWQIPRLGYGLAGDIGAPMNLGEEYRWNVPQVFYAFDNTFLDYFGQRGVQEVEKAIKILNDLPRMSELNLSDTNILQRFPYDTHRVNRRAQALNLIDLKSTTLSLLVEQMGLAEANRYVFTLRNVVDTPTPCLQFTVVQRNFDPITLRPSSYINGQLWTYVDIFCAPELAFPINQRVDPLAYGEPVASQTSRFSQFGVGSYWTGLTFDDVGGLRYIYHPSNLNYEAAVPEVSGSSGSSPWSIPGGTNTFVNPAIRPGVDKIQFVRTEYDSLLGEFFTPITNRYSEMVITNGAFVSQSIQRIVRLPDIVFTASDLGTFIASRTANWTNNPTFNGAVNPGPGVVTPGVFISFNKVGPLFINDSPFFLDERTAVPVFAWGSYDGTTNAPVIYPNGASIEQLESIVLGSERRNPWRIP